MAEKKTAIVTGASGGIGAGLVEAFLKEGYNVVATSLDASRSMAASPSLVRVDTAADQIAELVRGFMK
jgi:NAD(P)-dependent dehydrogenase (short-subunit alcohol dehydrogenase family)